MLETIPNAKGRITAVAMSGRFIVTAICVQLISYFYHGTLLPLAIVMGITIIITLITCYKLLQEYKILN